MESITACECIKRVLIATGFDNETSLGILDESVLDELYKSVDENIIESFECQHKEIYKGMYRKQNQFNLLPGHKLQILELATIQSMKQTARQTAMKSDDGLLNINADFFFTNHERNRSQCKVKPQQASKCTKILQSID